MLDAVPGGAEWFERAAPEAPVAALNGAGEGLLGNVGELLGGLLGGGGRQAPGGGLEDLLGGLLGGGGAARGPAPSNPEPSGDLGDLLGGLLGGGRPAAGGGGGIGGTVGGGGGAALLGPLATLLQNGFSMEKAARFLPTLLALLQQHAGSGVLAGSYATSRRCAACSVPPRPAAGPASRAAAASTSAASSGRSWGTASRPRSPAGIAGVAGISIQKGGEDARNPLLRPRHRRPRPGLGDALGAGPGVRPDQRPRRRRLPGCAWYRKLGVPVDRIADTLPPEGVTRGTTAAPPSAAALAAARWALLLDDPLFELGLGAQGAAASPGGFAVGRLPLDEAAVARVEGFAARAADLDLAGTDLSAAEIARRPGGSPARPSCGRGDLGRQRRRP